MPSRFFPLRLINHQFSHQFRRLFHGCSALRQKNHYDTLQIPTNATSSEVKKAFYTLSKTCHPDCNPTDSHASSRFIALSAAYSVLSVPSKRSSYDQTLFSSQNQSQPFSVPRGSYSSTNPVGGRSPSGLSRRTTQFRGPPASFYRNGGWGAYRQERSAAHEDSMSRSDKDIRPDPNQKYTRRDDFMRSGPGSFEYKLEDFGHHFDTQRHLRMHENNQRRKHKRSNGAVFDTLESHGSFGAIVGILVVGIGLPVIYISVSTDLQTGPNGKSNQT
ncbi:hypothetical protein K3495_g2887 [Podosphaera aphanis]|nr:hypothetical protein K3495_g2887 [Podosphaera aphanis]